MIRLLVLTFAAVTSLSLAAPAQAGSASHHASIQLAQYGGGYYGDTRRYPAPPYRGGYGNPGYGNGYGYGRGNGYGNGYGGGYGYTLPMQPQCYWEVRRVRVYVPHLARDVWQRQRVRVCN